MCQSHEEAIIFNISIVIGQTSTELFVRNVVMSQDRVRVVIASSRDATSEGKKGIQGRMEERIDGTKEEEKKAKGKEILKRKKNLEVVSFHIGFCVEYT
jgi:hypothetical protein